MDKENIAQIIESFFSCFISSDLGKVEINRIRELFLEQGIVIKTFGAKPEVYSLTTFIEPRQKLLTSGTLVKFSERVLKIETEIFGNIAQSFVRYEKSGIENSKSFIEQGSKLFQFVRMSGASPTTWKISSVAWDDEHKI